MLFSTHEFVACSLGFCSAKWNHDSNNGLETMWWILCLRLLSIRFLFTCKFMSWWFKTSWCDTQVNLWLVSSSLHVRMSVKPYTLVHGSSYRYFHANKWACFSVSHLSHFSWMSVITHHMSMSVITHTTCRCQLSHTTCGCQYVLLWATRLIQS